MLDGSVIHASLEDVQDNNGRTRNDRKTLSRLLRSAGELCEING